MTQDRRDEEIAALFADVHYWPRGLYFQSRSHKQFMRTLREFAAGPGECLDLGCGSVARYKPFIEAHGLEWYGADVIDITTPQANYRKVVNNRLDFEDDAFDVVCAFNVIEHFTHPEIMFAEIRRCLREGGILCGAVAFWEFEHNSFFHLSNKGLLEILGRHGFELLSLIPSEYSGSVLDAQRFFGGGGSIVRTSKRAQRNTTVLCNLNWIPFLIVNAMEFARRRLRLLGDPFKNCATLYFYARKVTQ